MTLFQDEQKLLGKNVMFVTDNNVGNPLSGTCPWHKVNIHIAID